MKQQKILVAYFNNDKIKPKISDTLKKFNFKVSIADNLKHALYSYMHQLPDIIIINPFFSEENLQGIDVLAQLKKNNAMLDKPVKFIGICQLLNPTIEKILKDSCDCYLSEKNIDQLENVIKSLLEKQGENLEEILVVETSKFADELGSDPLNELIRNIDCDGAAVFFNAVKEYADLLKIDKTKESDDIKEKRREYSSKIISNFWKCYNDVAKKYARGEKTEIIYQAFLRFRAILSDNLLSVSNIDTIVENLKKTKLFEKLENIYYADEWLKAIYDGKIAPTYNDILVEEFRRVKGFYNRLKNITTNSEENYYEALALFLGITYFENLKKQSKKNNEIVANIASDEHEIFEKGKELLFENEIMEMFKSLTNTCVGPLGSKMPLLIAKTGENLASRIVNKSEVLKIISDIEKIDSKLFVRVRLNEEKKFTEYRIMPYFILVPCSATNGICWDPWHNSNKRTSPGRVAIPILAEGAVFDIVLNALGSLRWRTAKENADVYWMEEGLSGQYYKYWDEYKNKIDPETKEPYVASKTNLEESFVDDYCKWIKYESKGQLKLKKEVREIFWFTIPFPDNVKETLKGYGSIYNDLIQKDMRRAKSRFTAS